MAYHEGSLIVPCVLDDMPLPQCLQNSVFLDLRRVTKRALARLAAAIRDGGESPMSLAPVMRSESAELGAAIRAIAEGQQAMTERLGRSDVTGAAEIQALLDEPMKHAQALWPLDPMIVNLDGYHQKNAYMVKYWDAIQAGRAPRDPLLDEAERRFFETLFIDPNDPSPLNGLGSVLFFERELDAAEFFIRAALAAAKKQGMASYPAAEHDLEQIRRFKPG
jgi:hypothetical protein